MEIRKLFGQDAVKNANANKTRTDAAQGDPNAQGTQAGAANTDGTDVVSVSRLSRQLLQVSDIVQDDSKVRASRVAELKRSIDEGTYSVSSSDVARSLVSYASDSPPLREV